MKLKWQSNTPSLELKVPSEVRVDGYIPTEEDLTFDLRPRIHYFSNNFCSWIFNHYDTIRINIINPSTSTASYDYMFDSSNSLVDMSGVTIKFPEGVWQTVNKMYSGCTQLKIPPKISGEIESCYGMFYNCTALERLPENYFDDIKFNVNWKNNHYYDNMSMMFYNCSNLVELPHLLNFFDSYNYYYAHYQDYEITSRLFSNCKSLKKIENFPIPKPFAKITFNYNIFDGSFSNTYCLSNLTFRPIDTPVSWENQIIDLTVNVGYNGAFANIPNSKYNHDSAVETINSLPDTSAYLATAGGTNTIQFTGNAGSATEGGAINTMTPEEIAVAISKGWTVTFS